MAVDTLGSVTTEVLYRLGDIAEGVWTTAEVGAYIREGYNNLVRMTKPLWDFTYLDDVAGTAVHLLPSDCLEVDCVRWNWRRISAFLPGEMRQYDARYMTTPGQPVGYILLQQGIHNLRKWPVPTVNAPVAGEDNANTRLEYYQRGTTLTDPLDEFDCPAWTVKYIRFYALGKCLERKGKGQDTELAKHYLERFGFGVARMTRRTRLINSERVGRFGGVTTPRSYLASPTLPTASGAVGTHGPGAFGRVVRYRR